MAYTYNIVINNNDFFLGDVRNCHNESIFMVAGRGCLQDGESALVGDVMNDFMDVTGLTNYLKSVDIIPMAETLELVENCSALASRYRH